MKTVRIIKSWTDPDLLRQTPGNLGVWKDYRFTLDPISSCDYLIILNHSFAEIDVEVPPDCVWCIVQEPPIEEYNWIEKGFSHCGKVVTQTARRSRGNIVKSHGSLPWHVNRTYDELLGEKPRKKDKDVSWITSNLGVYPGHRRRLNFLKRLSDSRFSFDLFGRGFQRLPDKWDGLAPYRYSIAVENHSCADYWTEKIADCFLARTMPIYFGATNISDYFPSESYVWLDIDDPDAPRKVAEIVKSDIAEKNAGAIEEARRRVLEEHQFFPRLVQMFVEHEEVRPIAAPQKMHIPAVPDLTQYYHENTKIQRLWKRVQLGLRRKIRQPK